MSLRARLMLGLVLLVVGGLAVADIATYKALQAFMIHGVDDQLKASQYSVSTSLLNQAGIRHGPGPRGGGGDQPAGAGIGPGSYAELRTPSQRLLISMPLGFGSSGARPQLPGTISAGTTRDPAFLTVPGAGGVASYRVLAYADTGDGNGDLVVIATPLDSVDSTLRGLLMLEAGISLAVLGGTGVLAWFIIRIGLRPLERIGHTADAIAAGDLSRRVEPATRRTEVGRLGLALNTMLTQIESAFFQRTESERRLRRFVADASHELRTPLTSIRGYAELFRRGAAADPDEVALAMRRIEDEARRMGVLVDDMLLLARLDQGRPLEQSPVDLAAVVADACTDARAVDPNRPITCQIEGEVVVRGDDARLRQVVGNLIRNALVHTPAGTPIEIRLSADDGRARLLVADHGPGLAEQDAVRIFEPFYRADPGRSRDRGGTGLGLSIAAGVVAAHSGGISVSRTDGGGATFEVDLPLAGGHAAVPELEPEVPDNSQPAQRSA